jgi:hypothetical protein
MRANGIAGLVGAGVLLCALASLMFHRDSRVAPAAVAAPEESATSSSIDPAGEVAVVPAAGDQHVPAMGGNVDPPDAQDTHGQESLSGESIGNPGTTPGPEHFLSGSPEELRGRLPARFRDRSRQFDRDLLVEAGYPMDRAEYLLGRAEELAEHFHQSGDGEQRDPARHMGLMSDRYFALKDEIGETEYERFLEARRRPTAAVIGAVYAGFGADAAGLRAGDEVYLYDNLRVFNGGQLEGLSLQRKARDPTGPPVPAAVRREGENILVMLPRGSLGFNAPIMAPIIVDRLPPPPE